MKASKLFICVACVFVISWINLSTNDDVIWVVYDS